MVSKLLVGGLLALLVSACSDAAMKISPQENADIEADGTFEMAKLRAHRTPRRIERFDANKDGVLQASEVPARLRAWFTAVDGNHDNVVTADEIRAYNKAHPHAHHQHHQPAQQHASDVTL